MVSSLVKLAIQIKSAFALGRPRILGYVDVEGMTIVTPLEVQILMVF